MDTPPLLLGGVLVFWGWQTGFLGFGIIMAACLEASRLIRYRIGFSDKDFARISDLCALIFGAMFVYRLIVETQSAARWVPIAFFPILAAQAFSERQAIPLSAIFWTYRRRAPEDRKKPIPEVRLGFPYIILCLIAASAANVRDPGFYIGLVVLSGWSLWGVRPKTRSGPVWVGLFFLVIFLGWIGQERLHQLHIWVENKGAEWFVGSQDRDPFKNVTAIGDIRSLKQSDHIEFRVREDRPEIRSFLLREASYNVYRHGRWFAAQAKFQAIAPSGDGQAWILEPDTLPSESLVVFSPLAGGKGLLKLATGTSRIEGLPVGRLEVNQYGAAKVADGPGLVAYRVFFGSGPGPDIPPVEQDLILPEGEQDLLHRMADQLGLNTYSEKEVPGALIRFFSQHFTYSLAQAPSSSGSFKTNPLEHFLVQSRSGHCEYFATATVLLLRAAGIPARYAGGYSVQEYSRFQQAYLVRRRHAHAWALAWVNGAWNPVDTTPANWSRLENEHASWFEPLWDSLSWVGFQVSKWRWSEKSGQAKYVLWLVVPLALILARRLFSKKKDREIRKAYQGGKKH